MTTSFKNDTGDGILQADGYQVGAGNDALMGAVAAGYKLARGTASVTGSTSGDITTGLTTVVSAVACIAEDAALGGMLITCALGGTAGHITVKVWKATASGDCTPILATAAKTINWIAVGT